MNPAIVCLFLDLRNVLAVTAVVICKIPKGMGCGKLNTLTVGSISCLIELNMRPIRTRDTLMVKFRTICVPHINCDGLPAYTK